MYLHTNLEMYKYRNKYLGGGLYIENIPITMKSSSILYNYAGIGGGLYVLNNNNNDQISSLLMHNIIFDRNFAVKDYFHAFILLNTGIFILI